MDKDKLVPKFSCNEINPFAPPYRSSVRDFEEELTQQVSQMMEDTPVVTNRVKIALLFCILTYRELMQISTELDEGANSKPQVIAQTLDDWAHRVKEETNNVRAEEK